MMSCPAADPGAVVLKKLADVLEAFYLHDILTILKHDNENCHFGLTIKYVDAWVVGAREGRATRGEGLGRDPIRRVADARPTLLLPLCLMMERHACVLYIALPLCQAV